MVYQRDLVQRACVECRCTEDNACIEFDEKGYAHACYWASTDLCSACMFGEHVEAPEFDAGIETRILKGYAAAPRRKARTAAERDRQFIRVPELAGMVARARLPPPGRQGKPRRKR